MRTFRIVDSKYYRIPDTWTMFGINEGERVVLFVVSEGKEDIAACVLESDARLYCKHRAYF